MNSPFNRKIPGTEEFTNSPGTCNADPVLDNNRVACEENGHVFTPGRSYCLVAHYQDEGNNVLQLRVRAVTMHFTNIVEGRTEYLLRVEFPNKLENQQFCQGEVETKIGAEINTVTIERLAFMPEDVCPTASVHLDQLT